MVATHKLVAQCRCDYDANQPDSCGVTPLMDSVRGGHSSTAEFLIESYNASIEVEDSLGRQAIHHAAQAGAVNSLKCLIEHGADVNKKASVNDITPLHYAAKVHSSCTVQPLARLICLAIGEIPKLNA